MSRKSLAALVAVLAPALIPAAPASAACIRTYHPPYWDLTECTDGSVGVGSNLAGLVVATTEGVEDGATLSIREHVTGKCSYAGVTTTDGRIVFAFGGSAESYSRSASQPQATQVNCRFVSPTQPGVPGSEPTYEQRASTALAGAAAAAGATTPSLQLRPVTICVSGLGVFGPIVPAQNPRFLAETCTTNAVNLP